MKPHVTDILSSVLGEPVMYGSADERQFWLARGTAIHQATALFDSPEGLDLAALDVRLRPYLSAYMRFRAEVGGRCLAVEQRVESRRYGYVGKLDRIIVGSRLTPDPIVMDIKTTAWTPSVRLQTSAYRMAYVEMMRGTPWAKKPKGYRRGAVALKSTGQYAVEVFNNDTRDDAAWIACLQVAAWKEQAV